MQRASILILILVGGLSGCFMFGGKDGKTGDSNDSLIIDGTDSTDGTGGVGGSLDIADGNIISSYPEGVKVMSSSDEYIGDLLFVGKGIDGTTVYGILKDNSYIIPFSNELPGHGESGIFNPVAMESTYLSKKVYTPNNTSAILDDNSQIKLFLFAPKDVEDKIVEMALNAGDNNLFYFATYLQSDQEDEYTDDNTLCFDLNYKGTITDINRTSYSASTATGIRGVRRKFNVDSLLAVQYTEQDVVYGKLSFSGMECLQKVFGTTNTLPEYGVLSFLDKRDDSSIPTSEIDGFLKEYN